MIDPRAEYGKRLKAHREAAAREERRHLRVGNLKLATLAIGLVMAWLCAVEREFRVAWMLLPGATLVALIVWHERVMRAKSRAQAAQNYYLRGIARMDDAWAGGGPSGERFRDGEHIYSDDLDLFGKGCLFELLSTARLPMGEKQLADWLRFPSPLEEIRERQRTVEELRERMDLRESVAVTGEALRARVNPESLIAWAEGKTEMPAGPWRGVVAGLSILACAALVYGMANRTLAPFVAVLIVEGFVWRWLHKSAKDLIQAVNCNAEGVALFAQILERFEREEFRSARLAGSAQELRGHSGAEAATVGTSTSASASVRQLARVVYWIDSCEGMFAKLLNAPALYTIQVAFAAEAWRRKYGARLRRWVEITGEMEALLSLSAYAFEHPEDPFPEFVDAKTGPLFDGEELGHPLIAAKKCVRNSVRLDAETRLWMVSGSNMSGKSTFLRTVGINAVLAMAGAPVRAKRLRMTPVYLGTRIRSMDSLLEARSNFYTEILRIRRVFECAGCEWPLLFLFDELLEGTNSKDRRIGAEGLLGALLAEHAIGIVSTHDLALTEITQRLGATVRNMHFQDYVENGEMRFDYKLREGVVAHSNALELMRLIGLKV